MTFSIAMLAAIVPTAPALYAEALDEEFDQRMTTAGKDPASLWKVYRWCMDTDREKDGRKVLRALLRVDPDHRDARDGLGHIRYESQWFVSQKKVDDYRRKAELARVKELGFVKFKGQWVDPGHLRYLEKGLVQTPSGEWMTPEDMEKMEAGWLQQDLIWVAPEDAPKMEQGLWKCGEDWLSGDKADAYHQNFERCWAIPSDHLVLWTSCSRETAMKAVDEMERGYRDLVKVYGSTPEGRIPVALFRTSDSMGAFCAEDGPGRPAADGRRLVEALRSTFMESWVMDGGRTWRGAGASFWDSGGANGDKFGVHDARMAFGLSFGNAMDPSEKAVEGLEKKGYGSGFATSFYAEKKIPAWFSWGAACYASRYFADSSVGRGGDPWWPRKWSLENLRNQGGLDSVPAVFEFQVGPQNVKSRGLLNASGLLVAFMVDGDCAPVKLIHAELKAALREGKQTAKIFARLRKELEKNEAQVRKFAGL